jgi:hypothetical protein
MIIGGADWYRFFGAGERMARLAARGSAYPALVTAVIAATLAVWAWYALAGVGVLRRPPLLRPALRAVALIYFARGLLGIPLVLLVEHPYLNELAKRMTFMVVTSAICIFLGVCYAAGVTGLRPEASREA